MSTVRERHWNKSTHHPHTHLLPSLCLSSIKTATFPTWNCYLSKQNFPNYLPTNLGVSYFRCCRHIYVGKANIFHSGMYQSWGKWSLWGWLIMVISTFASLYHLICLWSDNAEAYVNGIKYGYIDFCKVVHMLTLNSLTLVGCGFDFSCVLFRCVVVITLMSISSAFRWMVQDPTDDKWTLVQLMAWCC